MRYSIADCPHHILTLESLLKKVIAV